MDWYLNTYNWDNYQNNVDVTDVTVLSTMNQLTFINSIPMSLILNRLNPSTHPLASPHLPGVAQVSHRSRLAVAQLLGEHLSKYASEEDHERAQDT